MSSRVIPLGVLVELLHERCLLRELLVALNKESHDGEHREDKPALIGEELIEVGAEPDCSRLRRRWLEQLDVKQT